MAQLWKVRLPANVGALSIERDAPPSTYAIAAALDGEPGAWPRVASLTAVRAAMIWPGLYLAGIRGWRSAAGAAAGSTAITVLLLGYYGLKRGQR
jgi:hypothetical protein